jgi:hypothetical protein
MLTQLEVKNHIHSTLFWVPMTIGYLRDECCVLVPQEKVKSFLHKKFFYDFKNSFHALPACKERTTLRRMASAVRELQGNRGALPGIQVLRSG